MNKRGWDKSHSSLGEELVHLCKTVGEEPVHLCKTEGGGAGTPVQDWRGGAGTLCKTGGEEPVHLCKT
ncbi:unnamed protein product, partial [Staurois parvus]